MKSSFRQWGARQMARFPAFQQVFRRTRQRISHLTLNIIRRAIPAAVPCGPPRRPFSTYECVKGGQLPGQIVLREQPRADPARTVLRRTAGLGQEKHVPWPVFWSEHRDAHLVGSTLGLINERKELAIESAWGAICLNDDPAYRQVRWPAATRLNGPWTSVVARWCAGFHHWVFDALPRLALLHEFPRDTGVIVPAELKPFQMESLHMLGLAGRYRPTRERHLHVERYFFSAPTGMTGHFNPYAVEMLRRMFLPHADTTLQVPSRVYIQRVGASRGIVNEPEVIALLESRGYVPMDMERMTFAQQIQVFARAKKICALHGAALTNLVWCAPGTKVIELLSSTFLNGVYEGIAEAAQLDYEHLICPGDIWYRAVVDLDALAEKLSR
jgi:hypothetical protein